MNLNLKKYYEKQKELDKHIIEKKQLQGQDLRIMKTLALDIEISELAAEWRGFKFWSEKQEPVREKIVPVKDEQGLTINYETKDPLKEEFIDCIHFTLSVGLTTGNILEEVEGYTNTNDLNVEFMHLKDKVGDFSKYPTSGNYQQIFESLLGIGTLLGLTAAEVEHAYDEKNAINHQRQETGY